MLIKETFTPCICFLLKIEYMNNMTQINLLPALLSSGTMREILLPRMEVCCLLFRDFNCLCQNCKSKRTYHSGIIS